MERRALLLLLSFSLLMPYLASAQGATPAASADGPIAVIGSFDPQNFSASIIYGNPTIELFDASAQVPQSTARFVPRENQIIGLATSPLFGDKPGTYRVGLPIVPTAAPFDIDGDGAGEPGLMAFAIAVGANIVGDSYLEQFEQGGTSSFLQDNQTGRFVEGSLLLYAKDDRQVFPSGAGADGAWFTADDQTEAIPQGYTKVSLGKDGTAAFDRSATPTMDAMEAASEASPDYSGQSWVEALNSLIDRLKQRYAFTEFRGIDWEAIRATYVPKMQQAQDAKDATAYYGILNEIALGVNDVHVSVSPTGDDSLRAQLLYYINAAKDYTGNLGAAGIAVSADPNNPAAGLGDDLTILTVGATGPAHDAGWVPGTKIVSIDGKTVSERREAVAAWIFGAGFSTPEKKKIAQSAGALSFPTGATVTIGFILPGETEVRTATMVAGDFDTGSITGPQMPGTDLRPEETSTYTELDGYTVIKWADFASDIPERIAVLEAALDSTEGQSYSKGIVIDMRGNGGGWSALSLTMESYFFTADKPMNGHLFDSWDWSDAAGAQVRSYSPDYVASSPKPDLAYTGPVAILVDQNCASACEFFTQAMQAE
ncbi:MAG TPA: S41 family peptidase, partial [Thermomicrobiales bacterium]|nr:S41 family peptidase [Thermomicrobiales bacterium]